MTRNILAIDQGTTSSRAIAFSESGHILATAQHEFPQHYPADGWVEHDPADILDTTFKACREVLGDVADIVAAGITNQRETTVVWDRNTGEAIYNAIVWQDRRTSEQCRQLRRQKSAPDLAAKTGLVLDAYFSATKIAWILDNVDGARQRADNDELAFGTIDSFLIWHLTNGAVHATDASNASRTLLFNIHEQCWDLDLLEFFDIPASLLPEVKDCAASFGSTSKSAIGHEIPIGGVVGDQQGALFGQACFSPGMVKSTFGTGCFMVMNTGDKPVTSSHRLLTTVGYRLDGKVTYALEGSIFNAGTAIQWLRDGIGVIDHVDEIAGLLEQLDCNEGVYMIPAFTGLGAPHWDSDARGALVGLTRDTGKAHLVRAALEAVCYQSEELIRAMQGDSVDPPRKLRVDGGMVANPWLMQFLADITAMEVEQPEVIETTALGAALLAGLTAGIYQSMDEISALWRFAEKFEPAIDPDQRTRLLREWAVAVNRVKSGLAD